MGNELSTTTQPRGLTLQSVSDAMAFAKMLSASDFAPKDFRGKPESCLLAIQHGAELGLAPMQSVQSIAVVNGRPSIFGDAAKAVCVGSPVCEYVREKVEGDGDAMVATCEAKRRGYPDATISRFSVADAKKAGLWGKSGPWSQYPRRMLQMRARGFALRDAFPDVLRGLVTAEEAQDYDHAGTLPATPPVALREAQAGTSLKPDASLAAELRRHVQEASTVRTLGRIGDSVDRLEGDGQITSEEWDELRAEIDARHNAIEPPKVEGRVVLNPKTKPEAALDVAARARLAIACAATVGKLDDMRRTLDKRLAEGGLTVDQHRELVGMTLERAEILSCVTAGDGDTEHFDAAEVDAEARA
jgi:hypothetical protein